MASPASLAKHPLHPMLVSFPIGLWGFSFVSDLIHAFGWGTAVWSEVAFYTMAGGVVGAFLAAVPGLVDFTGLAHPWVKRRAVMHMGANAFVMTLFAVNLWVRTQGGLGESFPIFLSGAGLLLLGMAWWLGSELVYVHGVAVEAQHDIARKARERQQRTLRLV